MVPRGMGWSWLNPLGYLHPVIEGTHTNTLHIHTHTCTSNTYMHTQNTHMNTRHAYMHTCIHTCAYLAHLRARPAHLCAHTCIQIQAHSHICRCKVTHTGTHTRVCTYTYMHTPARAQTHVLTRVHTLTRCCPTTPGADSGAWEGLHTVGLHPWVLLAVTEGSALRVAAWLGQSKASPSLLPHLKGPPGD